MTKKYVYFQGKSYYPKLITPDTAFGTANWNIKLYLTPQSKDTFTELQKGKDGVEGILNKLKEDDDGFFANLKRPCSKVFSGKGEEHLTPPIVLDSEGKPFTEQIGNGSDVTCKCEYYEYNIKFGKGRKGSAIRLESVLVNELVPYTRKDFTPAEEKQVKGLENQPKWF